MRLEAVVVVDDLLIRRLLKIRYWLWRASSLHLAVSPLDLLAVVVSESCFNLGIEFSLSQLLLNEHLVLGQVLRVHARFWWLFIFIFLVEFGISIILEDGRHHVDLRVSLGNQLLDYLTDFIQVQVSAEHSEVEHIYRSRPAVFVHSIVPHLEEWL